MNEIAPTPRGRGLGECRGDCPAAGRCNMVGASIDSMRVTGVVAMKLMVPVTLMMLAIPALASARETKALDPNQRVCKEVGVTGSRFTKKTCHTRAEWTQIDKANANEADEAMRTRRSDSGLPQQGG